jgi:hypothetical protein
VLALAFKPADHVVEDAWEIMVSWPLIEQVEVSGRRACSIYYATDNAEIALRSQLASAGLKGCCSTGDSAPSQSRPRSGLENRNSEPRVQSPDFDQETEQLDKVGELRSRSENGANGRHKSKPRGVAGPKIENGSNPVTGQCFQRDARQPAGTLAEVRSPKSNPVSDV